MLAPGRSIDEGLGAVKTTLSVPALSGESTSEPIKLGDFKPVASYSYLDSETPSLVVPGSPPVWITAEFPFTPSKTPHALYHDEAAHRNPSTPLAPLIAAVKHLEPNFPFATLDLVTDRAPLLQLLAFVSSSSSSEAQKDFRIDLDLAGKTVLMTRWEPKVVEPAAKGIAHNFQREMTQVAESESAGGKVCGHERIVSFDLLGSKVLLRFPVPACTAAKLGYTSPTAKSSAAPTAIQDPFSSLTLYPSGTLSPQSTLLQLSTLSKTAKFDRCLAYELLFLSQTPSLYLARHAKGSIGAFEDVKLSQMRVEEKKAQEGLRRMGALLSEIEKVVREQGKEAKLSLVGRGGKLELLERKGGVGVPEGLVEYFL